MRMALIWDEYERSSTTTTSQIQNMTTGRPRSTIQQGLQTTISTSIRNDYQPITGLKRHGSLTEVGTARLGLG